MKAIVLSAFTFLLLFATGCSSPQKETKPPSTEPNILSEYIKTPLDKAKATSQMVESRNEALEEQFDEIVGE